MYCLICKTTESRWKDRDGLKKNVEKPLLLSRWKDIYGWKNIEFIYFKLFQNDCEKEIEKFEDKLGVLDAEFSNPNLYDNPQNIVELTRKREEIQLKLDNYYNQWIRLTEWVFHKS